MNSRIAKLGLILTTLGSGFLWASSAPAENESDLADLGWLAGHWRAERDGAVTEELWTSAEGGMMLGFNRQFRPGERAAFEYLRIEEGPEGIDYVASPGGRTPTRFRLARTGERSAPSRTPSTTGRRSWSIDSTRPA